MTRTARSVFPRAIVKDRSESKSGLDKSIRKSGGGQHNWGSLADEGVLESAALRDEELEFEEETETEQEPVGKFIMPRRASSLTEEERESARNFRRNAFKGDGIDLSAIARTSSAVSTSPPNRTIPIATDADTSVMAPA